MAISYDPKRWAYGNEFTPDIMNHIENGIKTATDEANRIDTAKVDKVNGKGLSTNDYTNAEKQKVADSATTATVTALSADVDRHAFGEQSGGRNIWDEKWGNKAYNLQNGTVGIVPSAIGNANYIKVKPSTNYFGTISAMSRDRNFAVLYYDSTYTFISSAVVFNGQFFTPTNCEYINFYWEQTDSPAVYSNDFAIIEGASGQYEPYIASNAILTEEVNGTKSMISDSWDDDPSNKVYYVGDLRIDNNTLYDCYVQTDKTSGRPSVDTSHWRKTSVAELVGSGGTYKGVQIKHKSVNLGKVFGGTSTSVINHGISGITEIVSFTCALVNGETNYRLPYYSSNGSPITNVTVMNKSTLSINVYNGGTNWSAYDVVLDVYFI